MLTFSGLQVYEITSLRGGVGFLTPLSDPGSDEISLTLFAPISFGWLYKFDNTKPKENLVGPYAAG